MPARESGATPGKHRDQTSDVAPGSGNPLSRNDFSSFVLVGIVKILLIALLAQQDEAAPDRGLRGAETLGCRLAPGAGHDHPVDRATVIVFQLGFLDGKLGPVFSGENPWRSTLKP